MAIPTLTLVHTLRRSQRFKSTLEANSPTQGRSLHIASYQLSQHWHGFYLKGPIKSLTTKGKTAYPLEKSVIAQEIKNYWRSRNHASPLRFNALTGRRCSKRREYAEDAHLIQVSSWPDLPYPFTCLQMPFPDHFLVNWIDRSCGKVCMASMLPSKFLQGIILGL